MKMYILIMLALIFWVASAIYMTVQTPDAVTDGRSDNTPLLYCFIGAGHGVAVFEYSEIGNGDILTDADAVFNLKNVCITWESYTDGKS